MIDISFIAERVQPDAITRLEKFVNAPFERIEYSDAIGLLQKSGQKFEFPVEWGLDLQTEHERWLTEQHVGRPVVVMNYPEHIKAFYMRLNDDGTVNDGIDATPGTIHTDNSGNEFEATGEEQGKSGMQRRRQARRGEGRQLGRHHHGRDVPASQALLGDVHAHVLQHIADGLSRETVRRVVTRTRKPRHQPVAHERVGPLIARTAEILESRFSRGKRLGRRHQQRPGHVHPATSHCDVIVMICEPSVRRA
mgnify:CR=1 FL=1